MALMQTNLFKFKEIYILTNPTPAYVVVYINLLPVVFQLWMQPKHTGIKAGKQQKNWKRLQKSNTRVTPKDAGQAMRLRQPSNFQKPHLQE